MMQTLSLRRQAGLLMWLVTIPLVGFAAIVAAVLINIAWQGGRYADSFVIYYPPVLLYMWAVWMMRRALAVIATGAAFGAVLPPLLMRVGAAVFGGALLTVFGVPLLTWLHYGRPIVQTFDGSAVALGVVGATLMLVAQLVGRAAAMRDELDSFF